MWTKTILLLVITSGLLLVGVAPAAADNFSAGSLRHAYTFRTEGTIQGIGAYAVGRIDFDGNGGCASFGWINFGGALLPLSTTQEGGSCTYTVSPEGRHCQLDGVRAGIAVDQI